MAFGKGLKLNNVTSVVLVNNVTKTIDLTPGAGKRWELLGIRMANIDDVARTCNLSHFADAGATLNLTEYLESSLTGNPMFWPNGDDLATVYANKFHKSVIEGVEIMRAKWTAGGASSGGTDADGLACEVLETVIA